MQPKGAEKPEVVQVFIDGGQLAFQLLKPTLVAWNTHRLF